MAELEVERHDGTLTLTLNRPDKRNALSPGLVEALASEVHTAYDDGTRLLVLRGNGRNLSAGFDLTGYDTQSEGDLLRRFVRVELLLQAIHHAPYATLALAHGRNFGAGADLFVACERRVAAPDTTFRFPGLAFGLLLGGRRLATRTGPGWARHTLAGLRTVDAGTAHGAGLVTDIGETDAWPSYVEESRRAAATMTPRTSAELGRVLTADTRDGDLADLVRSAAEPGLRERIRRYGEAGQQ
ncbi:enoyl-CoA hydratase/isomerase family protein [Actinoallomurus oryzae]|uniref:Enoyl-CoA hydratase/isomerase family protein n=1 Tax=Actinoallomurus oryzae TaxID=502180 RepID=A0ABP8QZW2_9ACTN